MTTNHKEHTNLKTGLIYDPVYKEHVPGPGHPECPERCDAVMNGITGYIPESSLVRISPSPAGMEDLLLCHTREYIRVVGEDVRAGYGTLRTGDTDVSERSLDAAIMAAGGAMAAVDAVCEKKVKNAFCVLRPPGHHATPDHGMGFCIFNNAAIAARHAQKKFGVEKVLIADWDVHHGNGTQEIFYEDPSVFFFSTHQWPCYPGTGQTHETGRGKGKGFTMNCPFPPGSGATEIIGAFNERLVPAMRTFKPALVVVSAGFDSMLGDTIGNFELSKEDFAKLTEIVCGIAKEYSGGRVVSVLEGGYSLSGLASAAVAHVRTLCSA